RLLFAAQADRPAFVQVRFPYRARRAAGLLGIVEQAEIVRPRHRLEADAHRRRHLADLLAVEPDDGAALALRVVDVEQDARARLRVAVGGRGDFLLLRR